MLHQSFDLLHKNTGTFEGFLLISRTGCTDRTVWMERQSVTRCCKRTRLTNAQSSTTSSSRFGLVFFRMYPLQLWQILYFISRSLCGLRIMPKFVAASLQLNNLIFRPVHIFERAVDISAGKRRTSACRVFDFLSFDIHHSPKSKNLRHLRVRVSRSHRNC